MRMRTTLGMVSLVGITLGAAAAQADGILVNIQPVVLQSPSGLDVATGAPPTSDAEVGEGSAFVIELWAQQAVSDPNYLGLGCVFADLTYDNANMSCDGTTPGAAFDNMLASGTCDNGAGLVDELGGCTFEFPGPGIPPDWVRIASVDMTADVISAGNVITSSPADSGVSVYFEVVPVGQVNYGATPSFSIIPPVLSLIPDQLCYTGGVGDTITVTVDMSDAATLVVGAQFFLEYDPNTLDFISIEPGDPPFTLEIYESVDEGLGTIDYSVGAAFGDPGTSADSTLAVITFEALAEYCQTAGLVAFRDHDPPNRLSAEGGGALNPALNDLPEISIDGTDPLISGCPGTVAADNDAGLCSAVVNWTAPTASDNCALQSFTATHDPGETFPVGTTPVTYTATDACGHTATCSFDVIVSDNEAPTISCPADVSTTADAGLCSAGGVALGTPTTDDNCGVDPASNNAPGLYPVGDTIVTWTVTDIHGNSNTCDQRVTVTDDEAPAITCPADVSVGTDAGLCLASGVALGTPTTSDNCGVDTVSSNAPTLFLVGDTIVTWTVTDIHGNSNTCDQTVTVTDDELPAITCPADVSVGVDAGLCSASGVVLGTPTTSDNCGVGTVSHDAPALFPVGDTIVTWTVTDVNGNSNTCGQLVTVTEDEDPVISGCPLDITVNADAGGCDALVTWTEPTASDNCGVTSFVSTHAPGDVFPEGTTAVTYTAEDAAGNLATCSFDVTVIGVNELAVSMELSPTVATPLTRCITFELWECGSAPQVVQEEITFISGVGNALLEVPCGDYSCMTVRDELHTLRRTLFRAGGGDFDIVGTQYVADFVAAGKDLIGGNLNDDFWIDILDFGVFSSEWGVNYGTGDTTCTTPFPHADLSGDGFVLIGDFSFIQIHFGQGSDVNCCGEPDAALTPGGGPTTQISVDQLEQLGLPELAAGDLNGDGWLDEADIVEFMQGARPHVPLVPVEGAYDRAPVAPPEWRR